MRLSGAKQRDDTRLQRWLIVATSHHLYGCTPFVSARATATGRSCRRGVRLQRLGAARMPVGQIDQAELAAMCSRQPRGGLCNLNTTKSMPPRSASLLAQCRFRLWACCMLIDLRKRLCHRNRIDLWRHLPYTCPRIYVCLLCRCRLRF